VVGENATTRSKIDHSTKEGLHGFTVQLDRDARWLDERTLFGGSPARIFRLTPAGRIAWAELAAGPARTPAAGQLARRLTDAGLAHPRPPALEAAPDITIVVPVRDRAEQLDRCLAALGGEHRVLVVDDASADPKTVARVAARHRATLLRRATNGGPGPARNTALAQVPGEFVAFIDSDCVAPAGWLDLLAAHFADPLVAAVAPRVAALPDDTSAGRYAAARSCLDLGDQPARVMPGARVSYVPTAALVVRTAALAEVGWFDPALRYGEDVDLIWRLHEAGRRVRYDPAVVTTHAEPRTWPGLLARRFRYGTSAAPLAKRHPHAMAPLVLPGLAGINAWRALHRAGLPVKEARRIRAAAATQTWLGVGRYVTQFAAPALPALGPAAVPLVLAGPVGTWLRKRPRLDLVRFVAGHLADDVAYGAGVYAGCVRHRTTIPLRPRIAGRSKGAR
jgi:mycofactocin system glycosyltransferase